MTLSEAVAEYSKNAGNNLRPRTLSNRKSVMKTLCAILGDCQLDAIGETQLDDYARRRLENVRPVSVNTELRAFAVVRNFAARRGVATGPAPHQLRERESLRVRSWRPAEVERLLDEVEKSSPALRPVVFTLAHTGLRCGEALQLKWEYVDLDRRLIKVWPSAEWNSKSGRPREVPIGDDLLAELRRLPRTSVYVFPSKRGRRWARWPQRGFDRARRAAGLKGGPHTLRHTYATEFLGRGGSLPMLAQILGHSDEKVTRIYAHLRPEHLAEGRNLVRFGAPRGSGSLRSAATMLLRSLKKGLDRFAETWLPDA